MGTEGIENEASEENTPEEVIDVSSNLQIALTTEVPEESAADTAVADAAEIATAVTDVAEIGLTVGTEQVAGTDGETIEKVTATEVVEQLPEQAADTTLTQTESSESPCLTGEGTSSLLAPTPDQGYETDLVATPVMMTPETPQRLQREEDTGGAVVLEADSFHASQDAEMIVAHQEESGAEEAHQRVEVTVGGDETQPSTAAEVASTQTQMSESSYTLHETRYEDAADEDTTVFVSLATDVISALDSIPSDTDADLVTVAEDDMSEDESVIFSPAPPAASISAASPLSGGEGAFLTEVLEHPEEEIGAQAATADSAASIVHVESGHVQGEAVLLGCPPTPPSPAPAHSVSSSGGSGGGAHCVSVRSSQRGVPSGATAVPMPPEPILSYAHVGCIAIVALVAVYFFFCI